MDFSELCSAKIVPLDVAQSIEKIELIAVISDNADLA